ncbi:hypothetical protein DNU06_16735 [Putridiphycobacter roseus]|uniref:Uncharacterized protein n=1 Tax=Putridiphycobacter roseus TaxID=2219161 RepID=A0A2W1MYR0_9FLAO|nr:tetratricopeptide repeat protein [Putridiphycobacter roseus]PZE15691.1 hypothetical protein DNU06_16735 [Putridiphycobacter roseus]
MIRIAFILLITMLVACQPKETNTEEKPQVIAEVDSFKILSDAIANASSDAKNWVNRADYFIKIGNIKDAKIDLEKAILLDSTNTTYRYKYGNVLIGVLDLAGAKYNFEYVIKRDTMHAEAYVGLGRVYALIDNAGVATAYLNKAYKINKNLPEAYFLEGLIYRSDYQETERPESWKRAKSSFQTAVEQNPNFYDAHIMLGVMNAAEDNVEALDNFNSALAIAPESTEAWYNKGIYYQEHKKYSQAKYCYRKIVALDTAFYEAYYNQGYIQNGLDKNYDSAIYFFEKATLIDSLSANAFNNLGLAHEYKGNDQMAIKYYKKAIQLQPDFALAKKNLDIVLAK